MYTIKRAAEQVGVSTSTLRAWESRYGVGAARRTEAGYRLYDDRAVRALSLMQSLVAAGWSVRAAAEETRQRMASGPARDPEPAADDASDAEALVRAAETFDAPGLTRLLDRRFSAASFESVADAWLLPALRDLGTGWETGRVSVAGEHLVAHGVARRLAAAYDAAGSNPGAPTVVIGLPPGSRHELGILAFAAAARRAGLATTYLGADVPVSDWATAVASHPAAAAVLAVPMEADAAATEAAVEALGARRPGLLVAVGGAAQDRAPAGCLRLGHEVGPGAALLARELGRQQPPPSVWDA
ncbi:MerR family transcriptional regulator [Nocardioides antri]|uniref:MerR family transcriptional regulator n=1 Tax=Nocardioides antri TaxID=2607659 RepID=A0A5B1MAG3_9ACTN|nr:MerR family transcriptional regulator [Nocardioides antri]KAA1428710.1 MerR family transcriptional regulator [Nocardioides antri]